MAPTSLVLSDPALAKRRSGVPVPPRVSLPVPLPISDPTKVGGLRVVPTHEPGAPLAPAAFVRWLTSELPRHTKGATVTNYERVSRRLAALPAPRPRDPSSDLLGDGARADFELVAHYVLEALALPLEVAIERVRWPGVTDEERAEILARVHAAPDGLYTWDEVGLELDEQHASAEREKAAAKERARQAEIEAQKPNTRTLSDMGIVAVAFTKETAKTALVLDGEQRSAPDFFAAETLEDGRFVFYFTDRDAFGGLAVGMHGTFVPKSKTPPATTLTERHFSALLSARAVNACAIDPAMLLDARTARGRHAEQRLREEARDIIGRMFAPNTSPPMRSALERVLVQRGVRGHLLTPEIVFGLYEELAERYRKPAHTETTEREILVDDAGREYAGHELETVGGTLRPRPPAGSSWGASGQLFDALGALLDNPPVLRRALRTESREVAASPLPMTGERFAAYVREALAGTNAWVSPGELSEEPTDEEIEAFEVEYDDDEAWVRVLERAVAGRAHVTSEDLETAVIGQSLSGPFQTAEHRRLIRLMGSGRVDGTRWTKTQKRFGLKKKRIFVRGDEA